MKRQSHVLPGMQAMQLQGGQDEAAAVIRTLYRHVFNSITVPATVSADI
jgi:hypothetical protein